MPQIKTYQEDSIPSPRQRLWQNFSSNPFSLIGLWAVVTFIIIAIWGPWLAPYPAQQQDPLAILLPPSWELSGTVEHFLGTDDLGRDIFSLILHGASLTFGMALMVVAASLSIGFLIGSLSGMMKGLKSSILSHLLDVLLSIPSLLMAILVVAIKGPGLSNVFWAVGIALTPLFVRSIHQAVHEERQKEYVIAAKLDGANTLQVFWYVIMPNVWEKLIIQTTLAISTAILEIAAMGFLNLGAQAPSPEWGSLLSQGYDDLLTAPWTMAIPGFAILISVFSINVVGDGLRSALAPIRH